MKTNSKSTKWVWTGIIVLMVIAFIPITQNISGQKTGDPKKNEPKVDIKVNRKTDKDGNITQYDSTYSWSWSSNNEMPGNIDSVFKSMQEQFFNRKPFNDPSFFNMPFSMHTPALKDSMWNFEPFKDFFKDDFNDFDKFFQDHDKIFEKYFHQDPFLKIPDEDKTQPPADNKTKPAPKENNKVKTEKVSLKEGVEI